MDSLDPVSSSTVSKDNKQKTTPSGSPLPLHVSTASQTLAQPTATAHLPSPAASSPCPMAYSGPPSPQNIPGPVTSTQASPVSSVSSPLSSPTSSVSSSQDTPATTSPPHALSAERSTTPNSGVPDCITTIPSSASTPPAPAAAAQSSSSASAQQKLGLLSPSSYPGAGATVSGTVLADSTGQTPTSGSSVTGGQLHIEGNPLTTRETLLPASETKLLLEAIETERLRRKTLEWYLKEIMREKEALIRAQKTEDQSAPPSQTQTPQQVMDGVDNYMFTKKRRLSFVSHTESLGHALQSPLKKLSISVDDSCISHFLSFPEDEHQAPAKTSPTDLSPQLPSAVSSSPAAFLSSFGAEIAVPTLPSADSTWFTPRRPSLCLNPSGSFSFKPSTGSFSINLSGSASLANGKNSFSWDPLIWTQSDSASSNGHPCNMDYRLSSFDLNMWTTDDQLKETLTEFFDF
jgi:hypothetical protein